MTFEEAKVFRGIGGSRSFNRFVFPVTLNPDGETFLARGRYFLRICI
jgi:hypothetical protein